MFWTTATHYTEGSSGRDTNVIYVVNEDGSGLTNVYETTSSRGGWAHAAVRWSPDGSRIAIRTGGGVATMASDGTDLRLLTKRERRPVPGGREYVMVAANPRTPHPPAYAEDCSDPGVVTDLEANPGLLADCQALLAGRHTLSGAMFLDWGPHLPIDEWEGVTVAGQPPRVTELVLRGLGLHGSIPASFAKLTHLERLDLWHNELTGAIPPELGALTNLHSLDLSYNNLAGPPPPELGRLASLQSLNLSHNWLTGAIPGELGAIGDLRVLNLGFNDLSGEFPAELGSLGTVEELRVSNNPGLTGCVPDNLRAVDAVQTRLQRCRPEKEQ